MVLAFSNLEESSAYLSRETGENWTQREILQACLDYGVFPQIQILTDRSELPLWMREGGVAELPFNLDLLSFLTGTGVVHIVRRDDIHYKIEPGLRCDLSNLRLSKDALNQLLAQHKQHTGDLYKQPKKEQRKNAILRIIRDELGFDPLNLPPRDRGKPWVKAMVKDKLNLPNELFTDSSFADTWECLRSNKYIKERM